MSELVPGQQRVMLPTEVTREQVKSVIAKMPDLVSYDPADEASEALHLRCMVDPGVPAQKREGWRGTVCQWSVSAQEVADEHTGEVSVLPSLALISDNDEMCRLYGWPAIKSWVRLLQAAGAERCSLGIRVRVVRRPSGTAGRSYWLILPET